MQRCSGCVRFRHKDGERWPDAKQVNEIQRLLPMNQQDNRRSRNAQRHRSRKERHSKPSGVPFCLSDRVVQVKLGRWQVD